LPSRCGGWRSPTPSTAASVSAAAFRAGKGKRPRNKYGVAVPERRTYRGRLYASRLESRTAAWLDLLQRAGQVRTWEPQPAALELRVNGRLVCRYRPDFLVTFAEGRREYWECKGWMTPAARLKLKLVAALGVRPEVRVVREADLPRGL
jgi:hypothetical protein